MSLKLVESAVRGEMLPYDKNIFRSGDGLVRSLSVLDALWTEVRNHAGGLGFERARARETAAMLAVGRWCYGAALARNESRGMHQRIDAPQLDPRLTGRLRLRGVDQILIHMEPAKAVSEAA